MNITDEKDLLLQAISNYAAYTVKQREILKLFVKLAINDVVVVAPEAIRELTGFSLPFIYATISVFKRHGIISLIKDHGDKFNKNKYSINTAKFSDMIEIFQKMIAIKNK